MSRPVSGDVTPPGERRRRSRRRAFKWTAPRSDPRATAWAWTALALSAFGLTLVVSHGWPFYLQPHPDDLYRFTGSALGLAGAMLGVIALIRRDSRRVCLLALAMGLSSLVWEFVLAALAVAIVVLVILALCDAL